jgi:hypothetical protein
MKILFLMTFFFSFSAWSAWTDKVKAKLPKKVQNISIGTTSRDEARKTLGAPDMTVGEKDYWVIGGFKYALELTYKSNKVVTLHYNFPEKNISLEDLKGEIDPKLMKASTTSPHTINTYQDKLGKLEVELSTGKIDSVRFN